MRGRDADAAELEDKYLVLAPGETRRLCDLQGPGTIVRMWFTMPIFGRGDVLRDVVWRMFWDGETEPSVECPIGDLFGAAFARPNELVSDRLVVAGGAYLCRFEMPFGVRAVVEIENQSTRPVRQLFFQIGYRRELVRAEPLETFHATWRRENPTTPGRPYLALDAKGRGRFVGMKLDAQNREWWLKPPWSHVMMPRGFGLGMLEGWEAIRVDGEAAPSIVGTGGEDYFSGGFYFAGGAFHAPTHGATVRSYVSGRVSAYRFHLEDEVPFAESIEVAIDHGFRNTLASDFSSVAYWYQEEPHQPFPRLPAAPLRRPTPRFVNVLQYALLVAALAIFAGGVAVMVIVAVARLAR
jgi:Protein of unknown function (DUF2961)